MRGAMSLASFATVALASTAAVAQFIPGHRQGEARPATISQARYAQAANQGYWTIGGQAAAPAGWENRGWWVYCIDLSRAYGWATGDRSVVVVNMGPGFWAWQPWMSPLNCNGETQRQGYRRISVQPQPTALQAQPPGLPVGAPGNVAVPPQPPVAPAGGTGPATGGRGTGGSTSGDDEMWRGLNRPGR
jgi:hypothetical protein